MCNAGIILVLLCVVDLVYTLVAIQWGFGGEVAETGPILEFYWKRMGLKGVVLAKIIFCGLGFFAIKAGCAIDAGAKARKKTYFTAAVIAFLVIYAVLSIKENITVFKYWIF